MDKVAVLGATGYVGTRMVSKLLDAGHEVVATSRTMRKLESKLWANHPKVHLRETDMLDVDSVISALAGCSHAYYFVHSMNAQSQNFVVNDRLSAANMVKASNSTGLKQIIYLGGLGENSEDLSKHLRSRAEVGEILATARAPLTTLRAAMIIGSGSASFEILRYLVDRLPVMVTPRWVSVSTQPIAIANALNYLEGCLDNARTFGRTLDIGGPEIMTYRQMMEIYAEEAGLARRLIVPVPVFTPRLSSYWIHLVTPVPAYLGRPLAEGLRNPTICINNDIRDLIPQNLYSFRKATRLAIDKTQHHQIESHWTDAGKIWPVHWRSSDDPLWAGGTIYEDKRTITVRAAAADVWKPVVRIGGTTGYYWGNWLWRARGILDKLLGGVGLRRGRRHPDKVNPGDVLDFWRVEQVTEGSRLSLVAEMRLPGQAVLDFKIEEQRDGSCELQQTARFLPSGLLGIAYWYAIMPLHELVFNGMLKGIARASGGRILDGPRSSRKSESEDWLSYLRPCFCKRNQNQVTRSVFDGS